MSPDFTHDVKIGLGKGLVSSDNKTLPEAMLTQVCIIIWCHLATILLHLYHFSKLIMFILHSQCHFCWWPGPVFSLLLRVSSDYAQPITGQVTEVTCPVIGRAQPELTPSKRQKMGPGDASSSLISPWCHICASVNWVSIVSDNGLPPVRRQAIICTNAGLLSIGPPGTNFSEILIKTSNFLFMKMHLKISFAKWRPFCLGLSELSISCHSTDLVLLKFNIKVVAPDGLTHWPLGDEAVISNVSFCNAFQGFMSRALVKYRQANATGCTRISVLELELELIYFT